MSALCHRNDQSQLAEASLNVPEDHMANSWWCILRANKVALNEDLALRGKVPLTITLTVFTVLEEIKNTCLVSYL